MPRELEARFPKLQTGNYEIRSKAAFYNCLAFVIGDERHWWEPGRYGGMFYWPPHLPQNDTLETVLEIFKEQGYETTDNWEIEVGFEKVAIYVDLEEMLPSHFAISGGLVWKSKLGMGVDIVHTSLDVLEGDQQDEYGIVERVLKRAARD